MGARSWSAGGSSPTLQTARTPACLQSSSSSSVCPSPPAMTVQQPLSSSQSSSSSPTVTAWHNQRGCDRPSTKHHRKWPSAARPTATITDQQATTTAAAVAAQRFERSRSVRNDLALDLPPCLALPDGEERPYGASNRMRIRDYEQESEIYRECIRPPPNRTVQKQQLNDCSSYLPFRCNSEGVLVGNGGGGSTSPRTTSPKGLTSHSSPSSILTVCCPASSTTSSTASLLGSSSNCSSSSSSSSSGSGPFSSTRLLLDMHGQPIVTRSKSMSTGSPHPPPLAVMVPMMNRSLESTTTTVLLTTPQELSSSSSSSTSSKQLASVPVVSCATSSSTNYCD